MNGVTRTATGSIVGPGPYAWGGEELGELVRKRVTQCALSRICAHCAEPLARPVAFVGTPAEDERNSFYAPPMHTTCAEVVRARPDADSSWVVVLTSGFEFVRPARGDEDRRPTFEPNSRLESR